jgi:hypothetical protein
LPVLLLAIASFGLNVFKSHSWPGGPLTFGGMALAAGWIRWESQRKACAVAACGKGAMRRPTRSPDGGLA